MTTIKRALISCTDKAGLVELGKTLADNGVEILSTGGTAKLLQENKIPVIEISDYTGFPEMMDGRLKTLHPKVHGGLLALRDNAEHTNAQSQHDIQDIDLVIVNLYAFDQTIAKDGCSFEDAIENIDIGGPTMLRAAAKNHKHVLVVTDPDDYTKLSEAIQSGNVSDEFKFECARKVFELTARYDASIARYLQKQSKEESYPETLPLSFLKVQDLRYGENPHQKAALYKESSAQEELGLVGATQLQGKELSFNNILDAESAYRLCQEFEEPTCVIVKHNNPCGTATDENLAQAFLKARAGDPVSSFGGIVCVNRALDQQTALNMAETFFEVIIAPSFSNEALEIFGKKKNLRLLKQENFFQKPEDALDIRCVGDGVLVQDRDDYLVNIRECEVVSNRKPNEDEWRNLEFAWKVCKHVKSNAIVYTKAQQVLGVGAGQMSRVDSVKLAAAKGEEFFSKEALQEAAMASDAFFPFRDGIDNAAKYGIKAVIQPGGSIRDEEVIQAANENDMVMIFTKTRHFRH